MAFLIEVWGDYACFTRPEFKTERVSYDVMTPSAARGLLEAIFWHPGMKWVIDSIHVLNPIRYANIRRNEVSSRVLPSIARSAMLGTKRSIYISTADEIVQRASTVLRDVRYVIEAHFDLIESRMTSSDSEGKFCSIIERRLGRGQCYQQPYFGTREFPAHFRKWTEESIPTAYDDERDLGLMLFDKDYGDLTNITPMFFRATLQRGVLLVDNCEVLR